MFKNKAILTDELKNLAISDYLKGMSYRMVGEKHKVNHKTVRRWVIKSGNKIRTRAEAYKLESERTKGDRRSPITEFKKGQKPWNKDTKGVMKANTGSFKPGEHVSPNTEFKKGQLPWNAGVPCSEETKKKISGAVKGKCLGDKHPNWQNGKSFELYGREFTLLLKENIRCRDDYGCKLCGRPQTEIGELLSCHHIDYNKNNCNEDNLISLCRSCHMKTNFNRDYWKNYFRGILYVSTNTN